MVVQVGSHAAARAELELLQGWKNRDEARFAAKASPAAAVTGGSALADSTVPRCAATDPAFDALMEGRVCVILGQDYHKDRPKEPRVTVTALSRTTDAPISTFKFTRPRIGQTFKLSLRPQQTPHRQSFKRPRHKLDVDGPNTAALCCKKRRLREKLITSRLSQPYSQPATHILNREGQKQGDKRFSKMATSIDIARRHALAQSTSFLRYSVMNRLRQRLGLGKPSAQGENSVTDDQEDLDTTTKAPWKVQNSQASSSASSSTSPCPTKPQSRPHRPAHGAGTHSGHGTPPRLQSARLSKPAALPLPPSDLAATKTRTWARIHPVRSPELRPQKATYYEDLEEDSFAFLHGDEEGLNDVTDDPDHVYSDFSVIFGGGGGGASSGSSGGEAGDVATQDENSSYEEYLDELDGISWVTM